MFCLQKIHISYQCAFKRNKPTGFLVVHGNTVNDVEHSSENRLVLYRDQ